MSLSTFESPILSSHLLSLSIRRHNFYLLEDVLEALSLTEAQFREQCPDVCFHKPTVSDVLKQLKHTYYNKQVTVSQRIKTLPRNSRLKFVPVCSQLRELLDIDVANLDD